MTTEELIFAGLFKPIDVSRDRRSEFLSLFTDSGIFTNEWFVFYSLIRAYPRMMINRDFLRLYLQNNKNILSKTGNINLADFALGEEDDYLTFVDTCLNEFKACSEYDVTDDEFMVAAEAFRTTYITETGVTLMEQGAEILTKGIQVGNRNLAGFNDMSTFVVNGISKLNNILKRTNRKGIVVYGSETTEDAEPLKLICPYGIKPLDDALTGIYETDMVSILAPPKGGKSRISAFFVHSAIVNGTSVVTWSIENGCKGIEALIRARHFDWFYNRSQSDITKRHIIDADDIRKGTLTGELKSLEEASWLDLRTNPKYGKWANIDEDFDADTFLTIIDNAVTVANAKLILVDYLQLVAGDGKMAKNERIGQCYQRSLQYLQGKKIAGIFPAQFKQAIVGDLGKKSSEELEKVELRDGGGETSEVVRTPSVLMALYADTTGLRNGELKLLSIPSRNAAPFAPIDLYADFAVCNFTPILSDTDTTLGTV